MSIHNQDDVFSCTFFKALQFIEEIHRSIDNSGIQVYAKSSNLALFGEFLLLNLSFYPFHNY